MSQNNVLYAAADGELSNLRVELQRENLVQSASNSAARPVNEYAELKQIVKAQGLLDKQPVYYTLKALFSLSLLGTSIAMLLLVSNPWLQLLNAVLLAFVFVQLSFIVHDIGHRQVFGDTRGTTLSGLFFSNLLLGASQQWWIGKHNRHHSNPNQLDLDPDIDVPVIAFTEEQALSKRGVARFIVKYQAFFFFPLTGLLALSPRNLSVRYVLQKRDLAALVEAVFMVAHLAWYLGLLIYRLGPGYAGRFIVVHQVLMGLYLATVFAPNHKGMPVLENNTPLDFLRRQVLTARNVKAHPLTDFWYGGLNYQIEHHLFPSLPRNKLREAQKVVRAFCSAHGVAYHETGMFQSYREILRYLGEVSAPLRDGNLANLQAEQRARLSEIEGGIP